MKAAASLFLTVSTALCSAQPLPPKLSALGAIVMDAETGQVLFTKNADLRLPPASTTKIMTGLLLAERCRPEETLTAPRDIDKVKESSLHLMPGEQVSAEEMLYALMLRSANDGCHTVALHISGSVPEFAKLMNDRALAMGCKNTTFVNPHGLTQEGHLTTARDLALMAQAAMKDPLFAKVVATKKHTIKRSLNQKDTLLVNRDKFLTADPRANGVKTGYTRAAGQCFVGSATENGTTIITAILRSEKWLEDQCALTDWAFQTFERRTLVHAGDKLATVKVEDGVEAEVEILAKSDFRLLVPRDASPSIGYSESLIFAPLRKGHEMGYAEIFIDGKQVGAVAGVVAEDVDQKPPLSATLTNPFFITGCVALLGGTYLFRRKSRRLANGDWS